MRRGGRRAVRLFAALLIPALLAANVVAQEGGQEPVQEKPAAQGSVGGFFSKLFSSDKTMLDKVAGAAYQPSNQSIGRERDLLNQRASGYGLMQLDPLQQYANGVLDKLKQASGIPGLQGTVYLLATDDLSAVTTADANIYISYRWFENINQPQFKRGQEDTLAALLGHELGHIALGHHNSDFFSNAGKWVRKFYTEGVALKLALDKQTGGNANAVIPGQVTSNLQKMQLMIEITDRMLHPAWKRSQESDADAFAVDVTRKAGYSYQEGVKRFLEINNSVEQIQIDKDTAKLKKMQAEVDVTMREGKVDLAFNKLGTQMLSHLGGLLGAAHPDPAARTAALDEYVAAHYKTEWYEDAEAGVSADYRAVAMQKKTMELFDLYNTVFEHESLITSLKPEDLQTAVKLGEKMTKKLGAKNINQDNWLIYYEYYRALQFGSAQAAPTLAQAAAPAPAPEPAKGKGKAAKPAKSAKAVAAAEADPVLKLEEVQKILLGNSAMMSFKPYEDGINLALKNGKRDEALGMLAMTDKKFELARSTLPKTIAFYARAGKPERAQELAKFCENNYIDARDDCVGATKVQ